MKALEFKGNGGEYFKIWIVNILLTVITFGLYYPWAKVRRNRYFYANTSLEERNFEYHALGKQIFFSYLIAFILFIIYVIINQAVPVVGALMALVLFIFVPWIIVKSMMFNLRMTSFSNVRFSFNKNFSDAYKTYLLLPIGLYIALIVLGIATNFLFKIHLLIGVIGSISIVVATVFAFAFFKKRSAEFILNNSNYGQGKFSTDFSVKEFAKIYAKVIGVGLALMIALFVLAGLIVSGTIGLEALQAASASFKNPDQGKEGASVALTIIGALYIGFIFIVLLVNAYSFALTRKYIYDNTLLDNKIKFASTLQGSTFMWIIFSNFLLILFTLGFGTPWAKVRVAKTVVQNTEVDTSHGFDEYISQAQAYTSAMGEQIGEAFDVDIVGGF